MQTVVLYLNEDKLDLDHIATRIGARIGRGCIFWEDTTLYQCGKVEIKAKSNLDVTNKIVSIITQLSKLYPEKTFKVTSLGQIDKNGIARVFCPGLSIMLDVIRREALDILDSFEFDKESRNEVAKSIAQEIVSDAAFSNFVISSERFGDPYKKRPTLFNGWLIIDYELKRNLLEIYQKKVRNKEVAIAPKKTGIFNKIKKIVKEHEQDIVIGIVSGLITEVIFYLVVTALHAAPKLTKERIDRFPGGKILEERQKITSEELAELMNIPEPFAVLLLNSLVKGHGARIVDTETRMYELSSKTVKVAMALMISRKYSKDLLVFSTSLSKQLQLKTVREKKYDGLLKNNRLIIPRITKVVPNLRKAGLWYPKED